MRECRLGRHRAARFTVWTSDAPAQESIASLDTTTLTDSRDDLDEYFGLECEVRPEMHETMTQLSQPLLAHPDLERYIKLANRFVDQKLRDYSNHSPRILSKLQQSIDYSLYSGGKRVRPLLCFVTGEMFGLSMEDLGSLACALEMIHTASLIMDDLPFMDDADMRRSKAANHIVYGQDTACLATIGLLLKAYEVVLEDDSIPADRRNSVVANLAAAAGLDGMVGGQFADLKYSSGDTPYSTMEFIYQKKTAALFVASGTSTAILGGASAEEIQAIEDYTQNVGFAFQVSDDLLDLTSSEEEVGQTVGNDRGSFAMSYGPEKSKTVIAECTQKAIDALSIFEGRNEKLVLLANMLLSRRS